jgi:hypothetical protein
LTGAADSILILNRTSQGCSLAGRGRDLEEFALGIRFDPESCRWSNLGNVKDAQRSTERQDILTVLKSAGHSLSPKQIATNIGRDDNTVRQLLFKMLKAGEVEKTERGAYITPHNIGNNNDPTSLYTPDNNGNRWLV